MTHTRHAGTVRGSAKPKYPPPKWSDTFTSDGQKTTLDVSSPRRCHQAPNRRDPMKLRTLRAGDEAALLTFLEARLDTSMIVLHNVEHSGLEYSPKPYCGLYVAACEGPAIRAVAGHAWNGMLLVQGETGVEEAARRVVEVSHRPVTGLLGPHHAVVAARSALKYERRSTAYDELDLLFALDLPKLNTPGMVEDGKASWRFAAEDDRAGFLVDWRLRYEAETLGLPITEARRDKTRSSLLHAGAQPIYLLEHEERVVSMTSFNAETRGVVQVGGVWTPPELRGKGFARAVVAASLSYKRRTGAHRSILFTGEHNVAAQRSYRSLGYERIGEFGLVLFN